MRWRSARTATVLVVGVALVGGGIAAMEAVAEVPSGIPPTVAPAADAERYADKPPADSLADATPAERACITRNAGTRRAKVSAWHRPEPRYKAYRAVLDAAYTRATGERYSYSAPIEGVPFGLLGHGLDEESGRVILLVDPKLIDPAPYARYLERVARTANAKRKVPSGQEITVTVQTGCFSAKHLDGLRDRMRTLEYPFKGDLVQRVGRDAEFDGRLHVLVHVDDRAAAEELRRREGPALAIYWTTKRPAGWEAHVEYERTYHPAPVPEDDLSDATPEQKACITRNDGIRKENAAYAGWFGDLDRRQYVAERLTRAAYKEATGERYNEVNERKRLPSGLLGYEFDEKGQRVVIEVDPTLLDLPAYSRAMNAIARKENRRVNVPPGRELSVLVQPGCFSAADLIALRDRMESRQHPGQVEQVDDFIRWDGRMHIEVALESRGYGENLRREEGPILAIDWASARDLVIDK